jgi:DNA-binding response OmpR family regulator
METKQVLTVLRLPARLTVEEAAVLLGFHPEAISVLVRAKMLEPLAGYSRGAQQMFATVEIRRLHDDLKWLGKATRLLREHFQIRNSGRPRTTDHTGGAEV